MNLLTLLITYSSLSTNANFPYSPPLVKPVPEVIALLRLEKVPASSRPLMTSPALEELREELKLLHRDLLRTAEYVPAQKCPLIDLKDWTKRVVEKCYAIENLEQRIEKLMRSAHRFLAANGVEFERFGKKHTNIMKQARLTWSAGSCALWDP